MRLNTGKFGFLPRFSAALLGGIGLVCLAVPANTADRYYNQTRVYPDSYGNLIIDSAAGYRQIIVGEGDRADEVAKQEGVSSRSGHSGAGYVNGTGTTRVYSDSHGNLVIESASGYKRIVVGEGDLVEDLDKDAGEPEVIYFDEKDSSAGKRNYPSHYAPAAHCKPRTWVVKGRSYMYGVPRGDAVGFKVWDC